MTDAVGQWKDTEIVKRLAVRTHLGVVGIFLKF